MSALTRRLGIEDIEKPHPVMWSKEGSDFQEWATKLFIASHLHKGSKTHLSIGDGVHTINNTKPEMRELAKAQVEATFLSNLENRL